MRRLSQSNKQLADDHLVSTAVEPEEELFPTEEELFPIEDEKQGIA